MSPGERRRILTLAGTICVGSLGGCLRLQDSDGDEEGISNSTNTNNPQSDIERIELQEYNNDPIDIGHPDHREIRRESDKLILHAGDVNADPADIEGSMVEDEVSLGTVGADRAIDFTTIEEIRIEYRHRSDAGREGYSGREDYSYFGVNDELAAIRRRGILNSIEAEEPIVAAFLLTVNESDTGRITEFLDVSDVTGRRNFGFGVQISSDFAQEVTLEVFEVIGLDASGNGVFTVSISGED